MPTCAMTVMVASGLSPRKIETPVVTQSNPVSSGRAAVPQTVAAHHGREPE